jgi:hypothetical protein
MIGAGWKDRQVDAALDEPDQQPYYYKDRVAVAAYRAGLTKQKPTDEQWKRWADSIEPTAPPLLTFDFHRLANECIPNVSSQFWSLRLCHPIAGRRPGTKEKELLLIDEVLIKLVQLAYQVNLTDHADLARFLAEKAKSASGLGPHWPDNVVARPARRSSYVSKATSKKSIQQFIDVLSLIHTGQVRGPRGSDLKFNEFLISAPKMRFDSIVLRTS